MTVDLKVACRKNKVGENGEFVLIYPVRNSGAVIAVSLN